MRRLPAALLSLAVPAALVVLPVVSVPGSSPRPVPPAVVELPLAADPAAARAGSGRRALVVTEQQVTEPFTTIGVSWAADPALGDLSVQVRTRTKDAWTEWVALDVEDGAESGPDSDSPRGGTEPLWAGPSDGAQVRVDVLDGRAPTDVRLVLVDPGTSPADAPGTGVLGDGVASAATQRPHIRSRAEWGADESLRSAAPSYSSTLHAATIHHTASSNDYAAGDVPGIIRGFYAYHVRSLGWSDIGYNVLVDKFGRAWEGRHGGLDRPVIGAHAGGFNTSTTGISMIGTYSSVAPASLQLEMVAQVTAWKLSLHDRDPNGSVVLTSGGSTRYPAGTAVHLPRVFGHRDVSATACPGDVGYGRLPAIRSRAGQLVAEANRWTPVGNLDAAGGVPGAVRVVGWAGDPDGPQRTQVRVTVDGSAAGVVPADSHRPDVAAAYPALQGYRGFSHTVPAAAGTRTVCMTALNQGLGSDRDLGCRTVSVPPPPSATDGSPAGFFDSAQGGARRVTVSGWALDADAAARTTVVVTVDGVEAGRLLANRPRPDLAAVYPSHSTDHGFSGSVPAVAGTRRVCITALNQGKGTDVSLSCRVVYVRPGTSLVVARGNDRYLRSAHTDGAADYGYRFSATGVPVFGDWNGDGNRTPGTFRDGLWTLTDDPSGQHGHRVVVFGSPGDRPVVGDWDGDGRTTFGVVRQGRWFVTDNPAGGAGQRSWLFGNPSDVPLAADWNGNGRDTAGVFRGGFWYITDTQGREFADRSFPFGSPGDVPFAADWDGDGVATPAVFRSGTWYVTDIPGRTTAETTFRFGAAGDLPLGWR
jgi:hypothetical protein